MSIDKIGMYETDEILKFMTEGEGRGFLGRSMFDTMYFEIERLHSIIKEVREYIEENQEEHKYTDRGGFTYTEGHFLRDSDTLLEILDKEVKE